MKTRLYAAYGSNLNLNAMARRCPKARPLGTAHIQNHRLVFRSVADIEPCKGKAVPIGLWEITAECEAALDRYEGVSGGLYRKAIVRFEDGREALVYAMNDKAIIPPSKFYLDTIREGYEDFGIDQKALDEAVEHASKHMRPTLEMWTRHQKRLKREKKARKAAAAKGTQMPGVFGAQGA